MANKNLLLLVLAAFCAHSLAASAQEQLIAPLQTEFDDPPPQLELPEMPPSGSGTRSQDTSDDLPTPDQIPGEGTLEPYADPLNSGDLQDSSQEYVLGDQEEFYACEPALLESTGTWLRRGFWYTEFDVVVTDRIWRRDHFILMQQNLGSFTEQTPIGPRTVFASNELRLDGGQNVAEAAPRLKLGRFLFRDYKNRDHAIEFVAYGGAEWTQTGRLDANPLFNSNQGFPFLTVPAALDNFNVSFSGATSSQFEYQSRLNSFEANYHVSSRMRRDRMELEPSGHWVRRAHNSQTWSLIAGLRYFDFSESLDWDAFDITVQDTSVPTQDGTYDVLTDNDLIGSQVGLTWTHERARWSAGAKVKGGIFLNRSVVKSDFEFSEGLSNGTNYIEDDNMSFLTDASLHAKWHLRPNVSIRAGLELMFLTSLSLAPDQVNFIPVSTSQNIVQGDSTFLSGSLGLETYW